jgi:hypothetical protein
MYLEIANPPATVVAEKGRAAMFEDDEDARVELARVLAEGGNRAAAAEAFGSIATDEGVGEDVRLEAARGLAEIDERTAAEACRIIAADDGVSEDVRLEAAMLARGDRRSAAEAFRSIAIDEGVGEDVRLEAARGLAEIS